jgi:hypothetical protein
MPSFVPHAVSNKGKAKAPAVPPSAPAAVAQVEEEAAPEEPAVDFFGIGTPPFLCAWRVMSDQRSYFSNAGSLSSSAPIATSSTSTKPSKPTISSAPTIATKLPTTDSNFGDTPTATDPYPGFVLDPSTGQWVAKDAATHALWEASFRAQQAQSQMPDDFDQSRIEGAAEVSVDRDTEEWKKREEAKKLTAKPGAGAEQPKLKVVSLFYLLSSGFFPSRRRW